MNQLKYVWMTAICLLTACATPTITPEAPRTQPSTPAEPAPQPQSAATLASWELSGAIAVKQHKKGWTASLNWQQSGPNRYLIRLFGPLGGGTILIEKTGKVITYRDGPKKITATEADTLLLQQTGVRLPVNNLYYWIRGVKAPGPVQSSVLDKNQQLLTLKQAGYTIDYTSYTQVNAMHLPSKIRLQGHDLLIKLIIKHWTI